MLGLYAFFYGFLHFITYIWFDRFFNLRSTASDILQRPFIAVGMLSFFLMIPLAVTSTNKMIKRLGGKRWAQLHRLTYVAGAWRRAALLDAGQIGRACASPLRHRARVAAGLSPLRQIPDLSARADLYSPDPALKLAQTFSGVLLQSPALKF